MIEYYEPQKNKWYQGSIFVKLLVMTLITLALLIPSTWIQGLVDERQDIQTKMLSGVADSWSGSQLVQGPVLIIPYNKNPGAAGNATGYIYLLPDNLYINAKLKTQPFTQGVFDVTVYGSAIEVQGNFAQPDLAKLGIDAGQVMYDKAKLLFGISDIKGLLNNPSVKVQGQTYTPESAPADNNPFEQALQVGFTAAANENIAFSYNLDLKGSNDINFLHLGKTTDVQFKSDWPTPQFTGHYLPDAHDSTANGSGAKWHRLYYNRPFPQQWLNDNSVLSNPKSIAEATFGVKLQPPVDEYRKVTRTNRYATLIIVLTFVSLFLTELIRKQPVHLFNYTLIGAAMIVYYILLLSLAEKIGYNYAYLISSVATIGLIATFTASLLHNKAAAALFAFILSIFYGFIFIIIQLESYALLVGAIALFIIVASLMYFSRKINWDAE